jgi:hypothetical protein
MSHTIIVSNETHARLIVLAKAFQNKASMDTVIGLLCRSQGHTIKASEDFVILYKNKLLDTMLYEFVEELMDQDLLAPAMAKDDFLLIVKVATMGKWPKLKAIVDSKIEAALEFGQQSRLIEKEVARCVLTKVLDKRNQDKSDTIVQDAQDGTV